ncbi:unnamed protein product [Dibothriocephalus latus]|uniref:G-protein coupled receptors family 1 profile domain-containing protein n=1 Tax=Dibothriocephalus latus TaxID=60516 RepID=A0A3P6UHX7_DIBLA|nr:unnamed protein product [Dibothriocephalus latus]
MATNTTDNGSIPCMMQEAWPEGPTYWDFLRYNRLIVLSVLGIPVCVVGIVTSGLSICMFSQDKTTPRTTRKILIVLSVVDVLYLLLSLLIFQPMTFCGPECALQLPLLAAIIVPLGNILECFRNWLNVLIGVERFLVISFSVRSKVLWTGRITNVLLVAFFGFSILVRLPVISFIVINKVRPELSDVKAWVAQMHSFTDAILVFLVPLLSLMFCSVQIARALRQSDHFRRKQPEQKIFAQTEVNEESSACNNARRIKLTRGLLMVIVTFTLFMLPLSLLQVLSLLILRQPTCVCMVTLQACSYVVALGCQINSTANFFVYILYWGKYRRMLKRMLCYQYAKQTLSLKRRAY